MQLHQTLSSWAQAKPSPEALPLPARTNMAKKNSLARMKRAQAKALEMERQDAERRDKKQVMKKAATVRRMSSLIAAGTDHAALMAAAARAVPESYDSSTAAAGGGGSSAAAAAEADGTVEMGGGGSMGPPAPKVPNIVRMLPKAGAWRDRPDRQRTESFDAGGNPINHGQTKLAPNHRRLSKSDITALNFRDRRQSNPSKSIMKKKGPKKKALISARLARAAAKRAGEVRMDGGSFMGDLGY
eukprot:SAG22_NODE_238_length_14184_cov_5.966844_8_plen_243_part_00